MIQIINDKEIMTTWEARKKYEKYYIGYVSVERKMTDWDNSLVYVVYTITREDRYKHTIPKRTEDGKVISIMPGHAVGGIEIGGLYFE